jgi:predicted nucleic acid-binding protein
MVVRAETLARAAGDHPKSPEEQGMNEGVIILIVLVALVVIAAALLAARQRRSQRLQDRFGPEYDRTVDATGDRGTAERELRDRERRRDRIDVVPLDPAARDRYVDAWHRTQARFVDSPSEATREADRLVAEVMRERGYPVEDFEQRAADVSVDHPQVVQNYRAARAIAVANERSQARTEDLRQALVHYRSLFEELLEVGEPVVTPDTPDTPDRADHPTQEAR